MFGQALLKVTEFDIQWILALDEFIQGQSTCLISNCQEIS